MTWTNNTTHGWHIDHIIPVKYFAKNFDFTDIEVQKKCWHYTNLQPLWAHENLKKKDKIIGVTCHNSKKLIKKAIENKASYIALGAFFSTKTKKTKYKATIKVLNWAKKTTNIPIVAIGGIKFNNYKKLLLNKANFLAISGYIWNNKKYKPLEAIKKLK